MDDEERGEDQNLSVGLISHNSQHSDMSPTKSVPKQLTKREEEVTRRIYRNVIVLCISFIFLFTSFSSMATLQSSINQVEGTAALSTLYMALVVSSAFLPTWMIKKLKTKWTLCFSMLCYSTYIAAQFYPRVWTLVPTSIILGLGAAPMWSAKCTYLTQVGTKYAEIVGEIAEVVIVRFFGIFFLFFQSTKVIGNIISSQVLSQGVKEDVVIDEAALLQCGVNFCPHLHSSPNTNHTNLATPSMSKIYTMTSIYLVFSILASVIVALFLDPLTKFGEEERIGSSTGKSVWEQMVATLSHMRHPYQVLIIPLTLMTGVEQAFFGADFTAGYVSCGLGIHMIGYIMMAEGVTDAICSISLSPLVKRFGRITIFTVGAIINVSVINILRNWRPHPDNLTTFFMVAGLWGVTDAVWQTQINALYSVLFPEETEAAFSNFRMWQSIGYIFTYVMSSTSCMAVKLNSLVVSLVIGMVCYYAIEVLERRGGLTKDVGGKVVPIDKLIRNKLTTLLINYKQI